MDENIKDFYTIAEFAEKLRVHPNTVRRNIKNGRIAAFKFSTDKKSTYRIPHTEIERLVMFDLEKIVEKRIKERGE